MKDEVIEELHEIKDRNAVAFGRDTAATLADLRQLQAMLIEQGVKVVELAARVPPTAKQPSLVGKRRHPTAAT